MKKLLASLAFFLALAVPSFAQAASMTGPAVPDIITKGFEAYKKSSSDAVDVWFKGSPLEADIAKKTTLLSGFIQFETSFGKYLGYEIFKVVPLTSSTEIVYVAIKFEKGPVWFAFNLYKATDTWTITTLNANQTPQSILPPSLLGG